MKTASGLEWHQWESVSCAICGIDSADLVFETRDWIFANEGKFRIVKCRNCELVYMNPRPAPDEAWKFYPRRYHAYQPVKNGRSEDSQQSGLREALKRSVLEDAFGYPPADGKQPPSGAIFSNPIARRLASRMFQSTFESIGIAPYSGRHRILDVGCGSGAYVARMGRLGWEAHGLEMNPDAARYAREQLDLNVQDGRLPDPRLETGYFDVVTMWDSFEHMPNPTDVLTDVHRLLAPGGLLIFNTPNFDSIYRRTFGDKWFNVAAPLHYYHYTAKSLPRLLAKAGFRIRKIKYPLGTAGLRQTLEIVLQGQVGENGSVANRLIRALSKWPHRISPRGHLLVHALRRD